MIHVRCGMGDFLQLEKLNAFCRVTVDKFSAVLSCPSDAAQSGWY
jgi:hypothetical protein